MLWFKAHITVVIIYHAREIFQDRPAAFTVLSANKNKKKRRDQTLRFDF
jgi:hypothetical protein